MDGTEIDGGSGAGRKWRAGEMRFAEVLLDPDKVDLTIVDKARLARVSERTAHRYMADAEFIAWVRSRFFEHVFSRTAKWLDAAHRMASQSSAAGFNDRQMLLTMAGMVESKSSVKHSGELKTSPAQLVIIEALPTQGGESES